MAFLLIYKGNKQVGKSLVDDHLEEFLLGTLGKSNTKLRMNRGYVGAWLKPRADARKFVPLHHMVWKRHTGRNLHNNEMVDHVNQNLLDNRVENLRIVDASERRANSPKQSDNTTGFKGVSKNRSGKYTAAVGKNNRKRYLGTYETSFAAAYAVNHGFKILHPTVPIPNRLAADDLTSHHRRQIEQNVERLLNRNQRS